MIGIYKITNPNGKIYIGQSYDTEKRFNKYKNLHCKGQIRLFNSLLKYGYENHRFEIIEECIIDLLNERERYWQEYYNVLSNNGMNCKYVSILNKKVIYSEETKLKMSISQKGKIISEEIKEKISNSNKGRIFSKEHCLNLSKNHTRPMLGKTLSKEHKLKISKANKGSNNYKSKKVIDIITKEIWNCVREAAIANNLNERTLGCYLRNERVNKTNLIYLEDYEKTI